MATAAKVDGGTTEMNDKPAGGKPDKIDKTDKVDKAEKADKTDKADKTGKLENANKVEKTERADKAEKANKADKTDKAERTVKKSLSHASKSKSVEKGDGISIYANKNRRHYANQNIERDHIRRNTTGGGAAVLAKKAPERGDKQRSSSTHDEKAHDPAAGDEAAANGTSKRSANAANKRSFTKGSSTNSMTSEGFELDDFELDEPFTDSDDEGPKGPTKMVLPIPRGRIRTLSGTVPAVGYSPKWGGPTMCLSCLQFFDLPAMVESFAEHLLQQHHIVVVEMDLIVDPKRYIEYWRQRFAKESVDKIFPRIEPAEGTPFHGKTDYYFEVSESLPEDYSLRQRLAMRRLEEALSCQQREREDTGFSLQCIFCRYTARGNRSKMIHHLYMIHHLNLGSPDNLVFVTEYIEHLKEKLVRNECIYCEKTFTDRNTLMDHMRKRNHREVNPKNNYYDKFYIINYLELGKRWLDVLAEDFEDTMPTFVDSDEEEEEDSWHEWEEDNLDEDQTRVVCFFCEESYERAEPLLDHLKEKHHFDMLAAIEKDKLDVYGRMKMVNYIRKQNFSGACVVCGKADLGSLQALRKHQAENDHLAKGLPEKSVWDAEEYLVPIFGNDHFLWMLESFLDEKTLCDEPSKTGLTVEQLKQQLLKESEENTVTGVIAEDLPELRDSALADAELYLSLKS